MVQLYESTGNAQSGYGDPYGMFSRYGTGYIGGYGGGVNAPAPTPAPAPAPAPAPSGGGGGGAGSAVDAGKKLFGIFSGSDIASMAGTAAQMLFTPTESTSYKKFDAGARQRFNEGTKIQGAAAKKYMDQLRSMGAQRYQALQSDLDDQLFAARQVGQRVFEDINASYDAQQGAANQSLISSGLYNSTVAPGMRAMVNRERGNALQRAGGQQAQYISGILGQRAAALAAERAGLDSALSGVLGDTYGLRAGLAQQLATLPEVQKKSGSLFDKLTGRGDSST